MGGSKFIFSYTRRISSVATDEFITLFKLCLLDVFIAVGEHDRDKSWNMNNTTHSTLQDQEESINLREQYKNHNPERKNNTSETKLSIRGKTS